MFVVQRTGDSSDSEPQRADVTKDPSSNAVTVKWTFLLAGRNDGPGRDPAKPDKHLSARKLSAAGCQRQATQPKMPR